MIPRRGLRPRLATTFPSRKWRAQGKPGAPHAPAALCAKMKKHTSIVTTGSPEHPGLPCAMVLTVSFVLSPVTGLCCHRRRRRCASIVASLISASGYQDHTTSPSAFAPFVFRPQSVHRIPPNVRDDGQRPSFGRDGRSCTSDLPDALSEIFFAEGLDTGRASRGLICPPANQPLPLNSRAVRRYLGWAVLKCVADREGQFGGPERLNRVATRK